ncbi:MAG TPA: hypothetical protein VFF68_13240 [Anaerolineaceae bacterium]|nr:hypothetical protein [Anaerolineaceae bacterium]
MLPDITGADRKPQFGRIHFAVVLAVLFVLVTAVFYWLPNKPAMGYGSDWLYSLRPATLAVWAGQSPYELTLPLPVSNPPWTFLLLTPIALLPADWGASLIFTLYIFSMGCLAYRMQMKPIGLAAFLMSAVVYSGAANGQINFISALGILMPAPLGLLFVLTKPQVGLAVALFWGVEAFRTGGMRKLLLTFAPVTLALLLSFAVYGFWPLHALQFQAFAWNTSLFPWSLVPAAALFYWALKRRDIRFALPVSPMLSPYLAFHSWFIALLPVTDSRIMVLAAVLSWVLELTVVR